MLQELNRELRDWTVQWGKKYIFYPDSFPSDLLRSRCKWNSAFENPVGKQYLEKLFRYVPSDNLWMPHYHKFFVHSAVDLNGKVNLHVSGLQIHRILAQTNVYSFIIRPFSHSATKWSTYRGIFTQLHFFPNQPFFQFWLIRYLHLRRENYPSNSCWLFKTTLFCSREKLECDCKVLDTSIDLGGIPCSSDKYLNFASQSFFHHFDFFETSPNEYCFWHLYQRKSLHRYLSAILSVCWERDSKQKAPGPVLVISPPFKIHEWQWRCDYATEGESAGKKSETKGTRRQV